MKKIITALIFFTIIGESCKKDKTVNEIDKLPAATQTGAKTFGCLVNGVAFVPQSNCSYLCTPPLRFSFDNSNGGQFNIIADNDNLKQSIVLTIDSCASTRRMTFTINFNLISTLHQDRNLFGVCRSVSSLDTNSVCNGYINLIKCDLINGIISGEFEYTISTIGCETKAITNGRFDAKL